jgi:tagatose-6-phosphate ketose/aldose isomerase
MHVPLSSSMSSASDTLTLEAWFGDCATASPGLAELFAVAPEVQQRRGFHHTLREIYQQPLTWEATAAGLADRAGGLEALLRQSGAFDGTAVIVLTGSGSSLFAAECLTMTLQSSLRLPVQAIASGMLLTNSAIAFPVPSLLVSFARSGNSPESVEVIDLFLSDYPRCNHLVITCCRDGRLAVKYQNDPRVTTIVLDDRTCDRSLVMTSSFTNMVLAGRRVAVVDDAPAYAAVVHALSRAGRQILLRHTQALADIACREFRAAVYLASGSRQGSARESALKMMEMTAGSVRTFAETYLGLRHGPMCSIHDDTLVVCFLSSDPVTRAYEVDLIRELNHKNLGAAKILVGDAIPPDLLLDRDLALECPGVTALGDENLPVLDALVGQVLAFFRCLASGLRPDAPSANGIINRVVDRFPIHRHRVPPATGDLR